MVSVFLSHSSKDKPFVRELASFLGTDGLIKVWLDEREILPGQNIVSGIEEGLDSGRIIRQAVVPVLDEDTVESLSARILKEEHRIYSEAIAMVLSG